MPDHTRWLNESPDARSGERFAALYDELKKIARSKMRGEFYGMAAEAMRRILVETALRRGV